MRVAEMRHVPTRANGQPAFVVYQRDPHAPLYRIRSRVVLTLDADRISQVTAFGDLGLLARFGLRRTLDDPRPF